ncbi:MAG: hypothetical protein ABEI97_01295 [Candidatus Nanohaloarchaea archaeon]
MMDRDTLSRAALFLAGFGLCAISLGTGLAMAQRGAALYSVVAAGSSWTGYLVAHYASTGRFLDGLESTEGDQTLYDYGVFVLGSVAAVGGIGVMATGLRRVDLLLANTGSLMFLTGYAAAHYAATGEAL